MKKGQRAVEKQKWLHERVFEDMKRSHQEHMRQTTSQMERELERFRKDNERVLEAKLKVKQDTNSKKKKCHVQYCGEFYSSI